jgi:hypothetical protein
MTVSIYVVTVRGAIPDDIVRKISVAHAQALKRNYAHGVPKKQPNN